jgi:hypothetical protein
LFSRIRRLALVSSFLGAWAPSAWAQHHHAGSSGPDAEGGTLSAAFQAAHFDTARGRGTYEALSLTAGYGFGAVAFEVTLPSYRLRLENRISRGVGDLGANAQWTAWHDAERAVSLGFGATLPTGNRDRDLGMGHVMLMPNLGGRWQHARTTLELSLCAGHALGKASSGHHHHHDAGPRPLVNPMNDTELDAGMGAQYEVVENTFALEADADVALPLGDGTARGTAALGGELKAGALHTSVRGRVPWLGDPFTSRFELELGVQF